MPGEGAAAQEIVFYSDFPLGFQNPEAEDRMLRFAARGHRVHFVEGLGIRNPRPEHLGRALRLLVPRPRPRPPRPLPDNFTVASPRLLPPRHAPVISRINREWLARTVLSPVGDPTRAIFWIRFPSPELPFVIDRARPRLVIYELVDEHRSPKLHGRILRLYDEAERSILARAGLVLASSAPIQERLARLHPDVRLSPAAAVDVEDVWERASRVEAEPRKAVYVGGIDHRFDAELVVDVARRLPDWRFELAGPALPAPARVLAGAPNVEALGNLPPDSLPELVASGSVCLVPFRQNELTDTLFPIKLILYLAAGRPVVTTPLRSMREFEGAVMTGGDAAGFAAAIPQAAAADDAAAREARVERARPYSWSRRVAEMEEAIMESLPD